MIQALRRGQYKLVETKKRIKVLYLDNEIYAWVEPLEVGEILVVSHRSHTPDRVLSKGHYRLYDVEDEPTLYDLNHLELEVGMGRWQSYLLLTGLPDNHHKRGRIIPTAETITNNPLYRRGHGLRANLATAK